MSPAREPIRGRGTHRDPANRFEALALEPDDDVADSEDLQLPDPRTRYLRDHSRTLLSRNQSPDLPFDRSLNPYRGCEHGCVYCYARPTHEYLGYSLGLDFETRILVKPDAPELLARELGARAWRPQTIAISGVTDPYQPIERRLQLTRRCLEVLAEFRNPVALVTKSRLIERDRDLLSELAQLDAVSVTLSITTLDSDLARVLEPRAAQPSSRLAAIRSLAAAGIPVGVNVAPVIPGLNDHEIPGILSAAASAGAGWGAWIMLRLPHGVEDLFSGWLSDHYPERRDKVLHRIESVRGGRRNDARFGDRMRGTGLFAEQIRHLFEVSLRRYGLDARGPTLSTAHFRSSRSRQLSLF